MRKRVIPPPPPREEWLCPESSFRVIGTAERLGLVMLAASPTLHQEGIIAYFTRETAEDLMAQMRAKLQEA